MSLYQDASLAMIPSAVKDGKLYSIKPSDGSGDFTFSRGSNLAATRVDVNGLIEKGRENLLLQSNGFDTTWGTSGTITLTSGQSDKDGGTNAWKITKGSSGAYIRQNISNSGVLAFSVYAKASTDSGDSDGIYMLINGNPDAWATFDLNNGTTSLGAGASIDSKIEDIGSGWYRCSLIGSGGVTDVRIYPTAEDGTYTATSGAVFIQDAQLEVGLVATDYIETTTTTEVSGITEDLPRLDYSGSCPSLLLEPQRSNSVTASEYFGDWIKNGVVVEQNQIISPDGSLNGAKYQGDGTYSPKMLYTGGGSVTSGTTYTWSAFVKRGTLNFCQLIIGSATFDAALFSNFDLLNGTIGSNGGGAIPFIESYGNDWYRVGITATANANGTATPFIVLANSATMGRVSSFTTSDYIYIYGGHYEQGSLTSYIPTYGTSQTRSEDDAVATHTIADTETLTYFTEFIAPEGVSGGGEHFLENSSGSSRIRIYQNNNNDVIRIRTDVPPANFDYTYSSLGISVGDRIKVCLRVDNGVMTAFINGVEKNTFAAATINFGRLHLRPVTEMNVDSAIIFPTALTDSECIALTS
jgi:hypothetical protein